MGYKQLQVRVMITDPKSSSGTLEDNASVLSDYEDDDDLEDLSDTDTEEEWESQEV